MLTKETIATKLREFICAEIIGDASYKLANDESFADTGMVDSFAMAQLGVFIEQSFGLYLPDSALTVAKMGTVDQIAEQVIEGLDKRHKES